jgi:hypothetical protein
MWRPPFNSTHIVSIILHPGLFLLPVEHIHARFKRREIGALYHEVSRLALELEILHFSFFGLLFFSLNDTLVAVATANPDHIFHALRRKTTPLLSPPEEKKKKKQKMEEERNNKNDKIKKGRRKNILAEIDDWNRVHVDLYT